MSKPSIRLVSRSTTEAPHDADTEPASDGPRLDGRTRGRFVLFAIPEAERVERGPLMRGFIELPEGQVKVVAWKKFARDNGNEYLSLRVGNSQRRTECDAGDGGDHGDGTGAGQGGEAWAIGPFYGRLFRDVTAYRGEARRRYFGFIESASRVAEDPSSGNGVYETDWQLLVRAHPEVSGDGRTPYISGQVHPKDSGPAAEVVGLPF